MKKSKKLSLICAIVLSLCLAGCDLTGVSKASLPDSSAFGASAAASSAVSSASSESSTQTASSDSQPQSSDSQPISSDSPVSEPSRTSSVTPSVTESVISSVASSAGSDIGSTQTSSKTSSAASSAVSSKTSSVTSSKTSSAESSKASSAVSSNTSSVTSSAVSSEAASRPTTKTYSQSVPRKLPTLRGDEVYTDGNNTVDASNKAEGYLLVTCNDPAAGTLICQVVKGSDTYNYHMSKGGEWIFPLNSGSGSYSVSIFTQVEGNYYGQLYSCTVSATLRNSLLPFLYTNSYIDYVGSSQVISLAAEITSDAMSDFEAVNAVFQYVTSNITYNTELAKQISSGSVTVYSPNLNSVLSSHKGICYDYAAMMAAMLRSLNIPCKLVTGYVGSAFHAWVSVYIDDVGWIEDYVHFEGSSWELLDPTFVSSGGVKAAAKYIGDGKSYIVANEY